MVPNVADGTETTTFSFCGIGYAVPQPRPDKVPAVDAGPSGGMGLLIGFGNVSFNPSPSRRLDPLTRKPSKVLWLHVL